MLTIVWTAAIHPAQPSSSNSKHRPPQLAFAAPEKMRVRVVRIALPAADGEITWPMCPRIRKSIERELIRQI